MGAVAILMVMHGERVIVPADLAWSVQIIITVCLPGDNLNEVHERKVTHAKQNCLAGLAKKKSIE